MASKILFLRTAQIIAPTSRNISCWTAAIAKTHRQTYLRTYPTILQESDGSTYYIRYHEPIGVIKLPLDLSQASEEELTARLKKRVPKTKVKIQDDVDIDFDENRYLQFKKK